MRDFSEFNGYKPVIKQEDSIYYVSESDIIKFIVDNSGMDWNDCCDYVRDKNITGDEGRVCWTKNRIIDPKQRKHYKEDQLKWIGGFFEAHPWMEKIMIVFDD